VPTAGAHASTRRAAIFRMAHYARDRAASLLGTVGAADAYISLVVLANHVHAPRVATDLAVLHERPPHVRLDVDLDILAAVGTVDDEVIVHEMHNLTEGSALVSCPESP